jgi:hypothetical protein
VLISDSGTSIMVEGIQVFFGISEDLMAAPREPTKRERSMGRVDAYSYVPSGNLLLSINSPEVAGVRKNWRDAKKRIESTLANFIVKLIDYGFLAKKQEEERQEQERKWEEARRLRIEQAEQERLEKERFSQLMSFIQNWQQSELIRQFADAVEKKVLNSELSVDEEWLAWVRKQADRLDPLIPKAKSD